MAKILENNGVETKVKNVAEATVAEQGDGFDVTLFGSSTWGDDSIEFQEDFEPFYQQLGGCAAAGEKGRLVWLRRFQLRIFCSAVDKLEEKMDELGGMIVNESLRIDGDLGDAEDEIEDWAKAVAGALGYKPRQRGDPLPAF